MTDQGDIHQISNQAFSEAETSGQLLFEAGSAHEHGNSLVLNLDLQGFLDDNATFDALATLLGVPLDAPRHDAGYTIFLGPEWSTKSLQAPSTIKAFAETHLWCPAKALNELTLVYWLLTVAKGCSLRQVQCKVLADDNPYVNLAA
jgi:hypothetical protein